MADLAGGGVTIVGIGNNIVTPTFNLASGITAADVGKPVKLTGSGNNMQVSLLASGDVPIGVLESYEDRVQEGKKTGAVNISGGFRFRYETADAIVVGESIVGATVVGEVKRTGTRNKTTVLAKDTTNQTVDVWFSTAI